MAENRVTSKNLFNFRPAGKIDDDIIAKEKQLVEEFGLDMDAMMQQFQAMSDEEYAVAIQGMMEGQFGILCSEPVYQQAVASCDHTTLSVPTTHEGEYDVEVLVHTPKSLSGKDSRPCIVYAHGGGAIAGSAGLHKSALSHMAVTCEVVVFNVDYRLAPGTRCPGGVLDFYEAIKYVASHAEDLGVDPARIAMAGESGGGYICAGAMIKLAMEEESNLVKLAIPTIPMVSDYSFSDPAAMTKEEREMAIGQRKIWRLIAGPDVDAEKSTDPLLYPAKANDEILSKVPPTIVWENEFDLYITEATRFASRLRACGRLLELVVTPGAKHGSGFAPFHAVFKLEREAWRLAIQEYLVK